MESSKRARENDEDLSRDHVKKLRTSAEDLGRYDDDTCAGTGTDSSSACLEEVTGDNLTGDRHSDDNTTGNVNTTGEDTTGTDTTCEDSKEESAVVAAAAAPSVAAGSDSSVPSGGPQEDELHSVYVWNVPLACPEAAVKNFVTGALSAMLMKGEVVEIKRRREYEDKITSTTCYYVLVSKASAIETCLRMEGILLMNHSLKITVEPPPLAITTPSIADTIDRGIPVKIHACDLPLNLSEKQARELFEQFGKVAEFQLATEPATGVSKGIAILQYADSGVTDIAVKALHGMACGGRQLRVSVVDPNTPSEVLNMAFNPGGVAASQKYASMSKLIFSNPILGQQLRETRRIGGRPTEVVQLLNVVYPEDLTNDEEYETILEEMRTEAAKVGTLTSVVIPRPEVDLSVKPGVGKVFLQFNDITSARKAQMEFNGRRYDGLRVCCAAFYPTEKFQSGVYTLQKPTGT